LVVLPPVVSTVVGLAVAVAVVDAGVGVATGVEEVAEFEGVVASSVDPTAGSAAGWSADLCFGDAPAMAAATMTIQISANADHKVRLALGLEVGCARTP
jgi:hypothetical protein